MKYLPKIFSITLCLLALAVNTPHNYAQPKSTSQDTSSRATGSLRGRVKAQKGKPLAGVTVRAAGDGKQYEVLTNAQGDFNFGELAPDSYTISFVKTGFKTFTTRPLTVAPGETVRVSRVIELVPEEAPYAVIRGAVLQGPGFTLPNALVRLERIDGGRRVKMETVSLEGGEFAFRLRAEPATYRITAQATGFEPASLDMTIESDEVRNIVLTLKRLP